MCVIAYKPAAAAFPSKKILQTCFNNNPDGGGFMFAAGGQVHIIKGLMSFAAFYKELRAARRVYGDNIPYVLHFRITKQAGVRRDCTHPFPLSDKMEHLRKLKTTARIGIAHNGIIQLTSSYYTRQITHSDTMEFITDYLSLIIDSPDYYKNPKTLKLIERLAGSRLAILDGGGHCEIIGEGWVADGGVLYSNASYKPRKPIAPPKKASKPAPAAWYDDPYYEEYDKLINAHFNEDTGQYDFIAPDCPAFIDGDDSFCDDCTGYKRCYKIHGKEEDI